MVVQIFEAATTADRLRVAEIARLAFGRESMTSLVHGARRLRSPLCARANAWLCTVDGEAVASLLCYELTLRRGSERKRAFGLGGVGTHPLHRSRGHATRLCREVAERHGGAGLLFSAIDPAFYERLGYVVVPAWELHCERARALADSGARAELTPLDPWREVDRLAASWDAAHDGWYVERDREEWRATLEKNPDNIWFAVEAGGYLRIVLEKDAMEIVECCTPDPDGAVRAAAALAEDKSITTWLEPRGVLSEHFEDRGRATTRPMLLGVDEPQGSRFSSADYF